MHDAPPAAHAASIGEASLTIAVRPGVTRATVVAAGELDLETAGEFRQEVDALRNGGFDDIAVDLAGVTFLDSTGLRILLGFARTAGLGFRLTRVSAAVQRLFELTATQDAFACDDGLAA